MHLSMFKTPCLCPVGTKLIDKYMKAIRRDDVSLYLKAIEIHKAPFSEYHLKQAIGSNSHRILEYLFINFSEELKELRDNVCYMLAIKYNHFNLVKLFVQYKLKYDDDSIVYAINERDDKAARFLADKNPLAISKPVLKAAVEKGDISLLIYLVEKLKWAHEHIEGFEERTIPWDTSISLSAAQRGRLSILKYLHMEGCPFSTDIYIYAVEDVDILKYICEVFQHDKHIDVLDDALTNGTVESAIYLFEQGYPKSEYTDQNIIEVNDLELIKYFHENGYVWDTKEPASVDIYEHSNIAHYCHDNNIPTPWECESFCEWCTLNRIEKLGHLWEMEEVDYKNVIQWLPREVLEDVKELFDEPSVESELSASYYDWNSD